MIKSKFSALLLSFILATPAIAATPETDKPEWPLKIDGARAPIVLYQPQPDTFKGNVLTGRAAVSIQPQDSTPVFGAVWLEARVETNLKTRMAKINAMKVTRARFTGATPEQEQTLSMMLTEALTHREFVISMDRLSASLENAEKETQSADDLKNDPPKIYVESTDAVLILMDGEPELRPINNSSDQRVVNTPYQLILTSGKKWKLNLGDVKLSADDLAGPWTVEAGTTTVAPKVVISKEPAELIVSKGEPQYIPLPDNELLYMANTESNVFVEAATSKVFILISGRWYTATTLKGPWTYVRSDQLPKAFTKIPSKSPKGAVRVSVAGTEEAKEALLDAFIPQTTVVSRKDKDGKLKVEWDGTPKFQDIEGLPVSYSLNASAPVFKVGKEGYFSCVEGIWYASTKPEGRWVIANYVPKAIYQIPPSCPYYNCKYVHVFESHDDVVYSGYYPGYVGSYPYYGTVYYGTGYPYHGYYGPTVYYPTPMVTFGFSFMFYPSYGWGGGYPIYYPPGGAGGWWGPGGNPGRPGRPGDNRPHVDHHDRPGAGNRPSAGTRPATADRGGRNNVYADRDGNISRQDKDGKWQNRDGKSWKDNASPRQDIQRDSQARQRGADRTAQHNRGSSRPSGSGSYGGRGMSGGGMRGGGGRGGGRR